MIDQLEEFFKLRPGMRKIFQYPGTFDDYISDLAQTLPTKKEKNPLCTEIIKEAARILKTNPDPLEKQLLTYPVISYADHLGLLNYKLLYNSNLLYGELIKKLKLPYVVVFASGNIPMVNKSHPRGFYFKGRKYNFFGEKQCKLPVFLFDGKLNAERAKGLAGFCIGCNRDSLTVEEEKFLEFLFFDGLEIEKASRDYETFSDQLTFMNSRLWKYYFDNTIRESIPGIIYLQSNPIILELLLREIEKKDSLISSILFDPGVRRRFLKNFSGIPCCWGEDMGTHFFWGVIKHREKTRLTALKLDEVPGTLVGEDFSIKLEREAIIAALKERRILQASFFDLLLVTFLEGYLTLGGFNQLEYLPQMQKAHVKTLREIGRDEMAGPFAARATGGLICGMFPLAFGSGIDLVWHYNSRQGKFNGNLDRGLPQEKLDKILDMKLRDMVLPAIELMLENM